MAHRPVGGAILVILALLEATVFPGPTEAMLVALTLGRRERAWWFAVLATAASVAGGVIGYVLGERLYAGVAHPLLESYGMLHHAARVAAVYRDNAFLALSTSGYTPIPYMLYTMVAGMLDVALPNFLLGSAVGRGLKYVPIVGLTLLFGDAVQPVLRRLSGWLLVGAAIVLLAALFIR